VRYFQFYDTSSIIPYDFGIIPGPGHDLAGTALELASFLSPPLRRWRRKEPGELAT